MEQQAKEQVQETINKVQKKYKVDIFGFGEALRKKKAKAMEIFREGVGSNILQMLILL